MYKRSIIAVFPLFLLFLSPAIAQARTWFIEPGGSGDAPTIQAGVDSAAPGDTVLLAPGTFSGAGNAAIDFFGKIIVLTSVEGADVTVIDCDGQNGFLVQNDENGFLSISNLTVTNAQCAFYCHPGSPTIQFCTVSNSDCGVFSAEVELIGNSSPNIAHCTFSNCATGVATREWASVHIAECDITGCTTGVSSDGNAYLSYCRLTENMSGIRYGIGNSIGSISYCDFVGNTNSACVIYGILSKSITNCTFINNQSLADGGAIIFEGAATCTITDNVFYGNIAYGWGGAICVNYGPALTISHNLFHNNASYAGGGAICLIYNAANIFSNTFVNNNSIAPNPGDQGAGGIHLLSSSGGTIEKNIIAFSTNGTGAIVCASGSSPTVTCNDIYGNAGGDAICGVDGGGNISADPQFVDSAGGDFYPAETSPCLPENNSCSVLMGGGPTYHYEDPSGNMIFSFNNVYSVGSKPWCVTVGDFNDDSKLDLVTANGLSDNVSILLGNGDGTFAAAVNYSVGDLPASIYVGDFNGDTDLDLAVANADNNNISILLGNGNGTFAAAVNYSAGDFPQWVCGGDFNGDTDLDLAVANTNSDSVSILLGNGDGTFSPPANYGTGDGPRSVFTGDFDGDTNLDLAVTNTLSDNVSILLGNGDGSFATAVNYPVRSLPRSVYAGDLDGDTDLDLAVANSNSDDVSILFGNGDGTFYPGSHFGVGNEPWSVCMGEFDGDSDLDLVTANGSSYNISVLLNYGIGAFESAKNYSAGNRPVFVCAGDFDGDTDLDLAVANNKGNNVSVYINQSDVASAVHYDHSVAHTSQLLDNYPNPFNPTTIIAYTVPLSGRVSLRIYDLAGRLVQTLIDEPQTQGEHSIVWNGHNRNGQQMATGVYFMRLETAGYVSTRKIVLLK